VLRKAIFYFALATLTFLSEYELLLNDLFGVAFTIQRLAGKTKLRI
jgi:hypothetical protein